MRSETESLCLRVAVCNRIPLEYAGPSRVHQQFTGGALREDCDEARVCDAEDESSSKKTEEIMNKVTVPLTPEQQKLVKDATGKNISELHLAFPAEGQLSEAQLGEVHGGAVDSYLYFQEYPASSTETK
jgi:hypothetical protein